MTTVATAICVTVALALALLTGYRIVRDQAITRLELAGAAATELTVLFYDGVRTAGLIGGHKVPGSLAVLIIYLIAIALVMPIAAALGWAENSRWGAVVLGVGALTVCVLLARIDQLWTPR